MQATHRLFLPLGWQARVLAGLLLCSAVCPAQTPDTPKVLIADVKIGSKPVVVPAQRIMSLIKTRPGQEFNQETINDDIRRLMETRQFRNVEVTQQQTPDGKVIVFFNCSEYPSTIQEIVYQGNKHLKKDDLNALTNLKKGDLLNPRANMLACQAIANKLNQEGRPFANVDLIEGAKPSDTRVVFNITEGPQVKIKGIEIVGNTDFVSSAVLKTHISSSSEVLWVFGGKLNQAMVDDDVHKLEEYYRSYGYHDVKVSRELQWTPDSRYVVLVFHISEGQRYRFKDRPQVILNGNPRPSDELQRLTTIKPDEFYNGKKVETDKSRIADYEGATGHDTKVKEDITFVENSLVQVTYQAQERAQARVGQIYIVGNEVTRQNRILRELLLYPGQVLSYPDVRLSEANLTRLGIFNDPQTGTHPTVEVIDREGDQSFKDILVTVQEQRTGSLLFGVGVNSDAGLTGSIVLNERNFDITRFPTSFEDLLSGRAFRGNAEELRIEAVPGTQLQRYSINWRNPAVFDSDYFVSVGAYYFQRHYNEYDESRLGTRLGVGRKITDHWSASVTTRIENVGVHNVPFFDPIDYQQVEGDNFIVGVKGNVAYDTRNSYLRPTQGELVEMSYEQVLGDFTFPIFNINANKYWTVWERADNSGKHVLAYHGEATLEGSHAPVFERQWAGGFQSMRGFQFRGISPEAPSTIKVGGDFLLLNSLEYQIPIKANDQIYFVTFIDTGTVERRLELHDYRVSVGAGVRFVVPMLGPVPIALDFGFPVVKGPGDQEQVFSFWIGFFR
ncbi:MAG: outer membrane protein assembly factor BamA [Gemmataceae bacterium]